MARSKPLKGYKRLPGHKYRTPRGKIITEYQYRTRKAQRVGFKNYTEQRRFRQSQDFQELRHKILTADPNADVDAGSDLERELGELIRYRREVGGGGPGSGDQLRRATISDRFDGLIERMGLPPHWKWRMWYSEVGLSRA